MNIFNIVVRLKTAMLGSPLIWVWLILMLGDITFGVIRAIKEKKMNSAIGIDGLSRKAAMAAAIFFFEILDLVLSCNLIGILPVNVSDGLASLNILKLGIADYFALHYALMEALSNCKNMLIIGIPLPKGLRKFLATWMDTMTEETNVDLTDIVNHKDTAKVE